MAFVKSILLAFSMFSAIPMPRVEWNEKNMRYLMPAFPLIGLVIGLLMRAILYLADAIAWSKEAEVIVRALLPLLLMFLPLAVTGGIHMDGFMDTCDALGSHADREKKLAIMKDSHCGAFAVMGAVVYFIADFVLLSLWCRFPSGSLLLIFLFSRLLSAFSVATFSPAKDSGLVRTFSDAGARTFTAVWSAVFFVLITVAGFFFFRWQALALAVTQLFVFVCYFFLTRRHFGGITGDTSGWFLQMAEILSLLAGLFFRAG